MMWNDHHAGPPSAALPQWQAGISCLVCKEADCGLQVVEEYPLSGEICRYSRRDRRKGRHRGHAYTTPEGDVAVKLDWDAPLSGTSTDTYSMLTPGVLQVDSLMQMGSKSVRTKGIYHLEN